MFSIPEFTAPALPGARLLSSVGATYDDVSEMLGMSMGNFSMKINGKVPMTVEEAKAVQKEFCKDATLDYLLK